MNDETFELADRLTASVLKAIDDFFLEYPGAEGSAIPCALAMAAGKCLAGWCQATQAKPKPTYKTFDDLYRASAKYHNQLVADNKNK